MSRQLVFILVALFTLGVFTYTLLRLRSFFRLTQPGFKIDRVRERMELTLGVALGQTKILRNPVIGFVHALVFWGFLIITIGTMEMVLDGFLGTERILSPKKILHEENGDS